jgi:hypothetical protein
VFIEFVCRTKAGKSCRAVLAADLRSEGVPSRVIQKLGRQLAPCLGRTWLAQIPPEDPFG